MQPAPSAAPPVNLPVLPSEPSREKRPWDFLRDVGVGPHPSAEVRAILLRRLKILAPLMLSVLVFYFFRNLKGSGELPVSRFSLLMQLVLLALLTASATPLYGGPRLSLRGLRGLELLLFGLAATYLGWLQGCTLYEAGDLRTAAPAHEPAVLQMALGSASARWLLLILAYGTVIPNTRRRCATVLLSLVLVPLIITAGAGLGHPGARGAFTLAALQMVATLVVGGAAALFACGRLPALPPQALEHDMVGQYQLRESLRAGGMGEVYLAEHVLLRRFCALKLVRPSLARDPAVRRRFEREARAMAMLRHPNAVAIHDCGRAPDGTLYYVMDYLPGLSLDDLVARDGPLPSGRVVYLLLQLCDALGEAHGLGILHLDIKPGNVIVCADADAGEVPRLVDFGLACEVAADGTGLDSSGTEAAGSPLYMAPEQAAGGEPLDPRADLYGLGGVAYFLLTGRPPFECESALQLVLAHACDPVTPPRRLRPDISADLEAVVLRCLEKEPAQRFADTAELAEALRRSTCAADWDAHKSAAAWPHDSEARTVVQGTTPPLG
jgi:serine/threonine-protein kinase